MHVLDAAVCCDREATTDDVCKRVGDGTMPFGSAEALALSVDVRALWNVMDED